MRFIWILIPRGGQLGQFTGFTVKVGHLLLGDQAEPTAKAAFTGIIFEFLDALGNLEESFLHNILRIDLGKACLKSHAADESVIEVIEFSPTAGVRVGFPQSINERLPGGGAVH